MVSADLVKPLGVRVENDKSKTLEAVDRGVVQCQGSAVVQVRYHSQETKTRLVVTPKLKNEVILSKTVLQDLEVIAEDFPNIIAKQRSTRQAQTSGSLPGASPNERARSPKPALTKEAHRPW